MSKKQNTETNATACENFRPIWEADDATIQAWAERNGIAVTITSACIWFKNAEQAREHGAIRCARINTKKNRTRGNWYMPRTRKH